MHLVVVGLNYRTAPVEIRERFAIAESDTAEALKMLKKTTSILEGVIVATCNRTEIYAVVNRRTLCGHYVREFMEQWFRIPRQAFNQHLYIYEDDDAVDHLFRVASGLDSMILGETQILGQVKNAFLLAQQQGATGTIFNRLFKQAVTFAKRVHSETSIGENAVSVSYAAVELGKRIFGRFDDKTVLIIGAGKMSELTARHLHAGGARRVVVAGRTLSRAEELAVKFGGQAMQLDEALARLHEADIVISSTGAESFVLDRRTVEQAMARRKNKPLFLIDIAVPRDIDPSSAGIPNVFLYDIDDLEGIVEGNLEKRRQEAVRIEAMIAEERRLYKEWYATLGVSPLIQALQERAQAVHAQTLESMFRKLPDLDEREQKVIRKLTKSMVNQMIHDPILRIKELAADRKREEAIRLFVHLFALEEEVAKLEAEAGKEAGRKGAAPEGAATVRDWDKILARLVGALP